MNFADSEVVASILKEDGYELTDDSKSANLVLLNTCSIRDKAEKTVRNKLKTYNSYKKDNSDLKIGLLGCMAERLKDKLLEEEKMVDLVVGPDSYKDLPNLLDEVDHNQKAVNVILSKSETYGDISPVTNIGQFIAAIIMIMGYSIIAVPTGIVTSSMNFTKDKYTKTCIVCNDDRQSRLAKYCNQCGAVMPGEE